MKDKPTKPNGTLCKGKEEYQVYWDFTDGSIHWITGPMAGDKSLVNMDGWKERGFKFKPLSPEAVKEVKAYSTGPFKWPDYWGYITYEDIEGLPSESVESFTLLGDHDVVLTDPFERWIQEDLRSKKGDNVKHPNHYNQDGVESDGGPSEYYDFDPGWKTWNDFADYKAWAQWKEHSFHLGNVGKSICRWGDKGGTTKTYDARKIVYSGLRVLMMLEGKSVVRKYLDDLRENPQFRD